MALPRGTFKSSILIVFCRQLRTIDAQDLPSQFRKRSFQDLPRRSRKSHEKTNLMCELKRLFGMTLTTSKKNKTKKNTRRVE